MIGIQFSPLAAAVIDAGEAAVEILSPAVTVRGVGAENCIAILQLLQPAERVVHIVNVGQRLALGIDFGIYGAVGVVRVTGRAVFRVDHRLDPLVTIISERAGLGDHRAAIIRDPPTRHGDGHQLIERVVGVIQRLLTDSFVCLPPIFH